MRTSLRAWLIWNGRRLKPLPDRSIKIAGRLILPHLRRGEFDLRGELTRNPT